MLAEDYSVDLLCMSPDPVTVDTVDALRDDFHTVVVCQIPRWRYALSALAGSLRGGAAEVAMYDQAPVRQWVRSSSSQYAVVYVHLVRMASYIPHVRRASVVLDLADAISLHYDEARQHPAAGLLRRLYYWTQHSRMRHAEALGIQGSQKVLVHTAEDATYLRGLVAPGHADRIRVSPMALPAE